MSDLEDPTSKNSSLGDGGMEDLLDKAEANLKFPEWWCQIFKHYFHYTEVTIIGFCVVGAVFLLLGFLGVGISGVLSAAFLLGLSFLALKFVWGIKGIRSLATYAEGLKQQVNSFKEKNKELKQQNDVFKGHNEKQTSELQELAGEIGLVGESVDNITIAIDKLDQITKEQEHLQYLRDQIVEKERQMKEEMKIANDDNKSENIKQKMGNIFFEVDDDYSETIDHEEVEQLKERMEEEGVMWNKDFEAILTDDGSIYKWEFMSVLDRILNTRFSRIKNGVEEHAELQKRVKELEAQLNR